MYKYERGGRATGYLAASLLTLALLATLAPGVAASKPVAEVDKTLPDSGKFCQQLGDYYSRTKNGTDRAFNEVSVYGRARTVRVHWDGRAPSRAAAALLTATLRHALRYRGVALTLLPARVQPHHLCTLARYAQRDCEHIETSGDIYDNVTISPSMAWTGLKCPPLEWCPSWSRDQLAAAPRLQALGAGAAPSALRLHAHLTPGAERNPDCARANHWTFYTNMTLLELCGFTSLDESVSAATMFTPANQTGATNRLIKRIANSALHLKITSLQLDMEPRSKLFILLNGRKSSFLFLDYEIWKGSPGVITVTLPPPDIVGQPIELDTMRGLRVADDFLLRQVAPQILRTLHIFSPSPEDLRNVLELETEHGIEEAACAWAIKNKLKFESWYQSESKEQRRLWIAVFLCSKDPDQEEYKKVAMAMEKLLCAETELNVGVYFHEIDCADEGNLNNEFLKSTMSYKWQTLIGAVAAGRGMAMAAESALRMGTALVFYDVPAPTVQLRGGARAASGSVHQLAIAIGHFLTKFKWKRLALISENTELAKGLYEALKLNDNIALNDTVLTNVTPKAVLETLNLMKRFNPRIMNVNTSPEIAINVLCAAHKLGMTAPGEYTWILREWRSTELKCANELVQMSFFTISFWWRGGNFSDLSDYSMRKRLDLWEGATWPPLAAPLADALVLLMKSFRAFTKSHPEKYYEIHGHGAVKLLLESLKNQHTNGVIQNLQYDENGTFSRPLVFVDRWKGKLREPLLQWRIKNGLVELITQIQQDIYPGPAPTDGSPACFTSTYGDSFFPHCYDFVWFTTLACLLMATLALLIAQRFRVRRLARRDSLLTAQLLAQREFVATELADRYVDRAALTLYHDLGRGSFGRVRYAILRAPQRPPVSVAVKELRDDITPAQESELLREAYTLATLCHDHVVRLIGVCATGERLLVLLEYAFFGDLRGYLYERRHLAERATGIEVEETDEAYHISATSLTRLAREVASALEYLAAVRLVHRDVRACNCLVDARRSLKLADFGLARKTVTGQDGEQDEYLCKRRGLFPVLWMAPESLERGVFTAASDAWALGVLLLELVTLGARPYGSWPPMRVMRYVTTGGHPPLPVDATPETRRILMECWRSVPEERLTAELLLAELDASRDALRPCLLPPELPAHEDSSAPEGEPLV